MGVSVLYAYRLQLMLDTLPNTDNTDVTQGIENARERISKRLVSSFSGDPLPDQQILFRIPETNSEVGVEVDIIVTILWRVQAPPTQENLIQEIKKFVADLPPGLFPIVSWILDFHVCRNGHHQLCSPWERVITADTQVVR